MASDGQGRAQTGLGGMGRWSALAVEAARVINAAVLTLFIFLEVATCAQLMIVGGARLWRSQSGPRHDIYNRRTRT